jgi:hypothetical protein
MDVHLKSLSLAHHGHKWQPWAITIASICKRHDRPTFPRLTIVRDTAGGYGSRGGDDAGWRQA